MTKFNFYIKFYLSVALVTFLLLQVYLKVGKIVHSALLKLLNILTSLPHLLPKYV